MSAAQWDCGTPRSQSNAFSIVPRGIEAPAAPLPRAKRVPPSITLAGTRVLDRNGRQCVDLVPSPLTGRI